MTILCRYGLDAMNKCFVFLYYLSVTLPINIFLTFNAFISTIECIWTQNFTRV